MGFVGLVEFALQCFDVLAWPLLALLYPLCCSIRAIEANSISDSQRLNAYWVVFSLILLFEHAFMKFLEWLPLWPHIRLMIVFWLLIPQYGGAFYVYNHLIRPCLSMDLQIVINWFNKRKKSSFDRDNFLAEVERYVKENGPEALENIVASTSEKTKSSPDVKEFKAVSLENKEKTPFEGAYGLKPQNVLDLVPLPEEMKMSDDGEGLADQVKRVHEEVRAVIKASNESSAVAANQNQKVKDFEEGDMVWVHLKKERFPKGTYHKLKSEMFGGPYKVLKKMSSIACMIELPPDLQISPYFNVSDMFLLQSEKTKSSPDAKEFKAVSLENKEKTPFEGAYGLKPQNVLDLVPLPEEMKMSDDGEGLADLVKRVREEVRAVAANQHQKVKDFEEGDMVLVHLKKERFPKGTYHKLKSEMFGGPYKVLKKMSSIACMIELPPDLQISPYFNVSDMYLFEGFDEETISKEAQIQQLPKEQPDIVEDVLDVKEVTSRRGNQYRRFLVKWLGKNATENTWIAEYDLKRIVPERYAEVVKAFSPESTSSQPGGVDAGASVC